MEPRWLQFKGRSCKRHRWMTTSINNHPPMFGWHHFWESDKRNHCQASMRSFARIKSRIWKREKSTSTKTTWWLWKVTYAWIREYFRILCKNIGHIQSNKKTWEEDGRDTYGREDHKLAIKEVPLYGGCDRGVVKYRFSFNTRCNGKITAHEERVNEIEKDMGALIST